VAYKKVQNDKLLARIKCYAREEEKWKEEKKRLLEELQAVKASNECLEMQKWNLDRNKSINVGIPKDLITSTQEALERRDLSTTNTKRDIEVYNKEYPALRRALQGGYKDLDTGEIIPVRGKSQNREKRTKDKKEEELEKINREMRKLSLRRNQLKKERKEETVTEGETEIEIEIEDTSKRRGKPRVISNIQVRPPRYFGPKEDARLKDTKTEYRQTKGEEQEWEVVNRNKKKKE